MIAFDGDRLTTKAELDEVVARGMRAAEVPQLPAIIAAADGVIDLTFLRKPATPMPRHLLDFGRPHLVIVGDDPPMHFPLSLGPTGWRCAERLRYFQPRSCLVHACGGEQADYLAAAQIAYRDGRFLLIETSSAQGPAWGRAIERLCPTSVYLPRDGQHPVEETRH